jgi:hypothetical protein
MYPAAHENHQHPFSPTISTPSNPQQEDMGKAKPADTCTNLGFEAKLWLAADKPRNNMDAAEYKHVVLGLIFLEDISETLDEHHTKLVAGKSDYKDAKPENEDEHLPANLIWARKNAHSVRFIDARVPQRHTASQQ